MAPWPFVLTVLAAYRVTRFVVTDSLIDGARRRLFLRFPPDETYARASGRLKLSKIGQLFDCPACFGWWASGGALGVATAFGAGPEHPGLFLAIWWAVAGGQVLLSWLDGWLTR